MPDVIDREKIEALLAQAVTTVDKVAYTELLSYLGDPPSLASVPDSFWINHGERLADELRPIIEDTYLTQAALLMDEVGVPISWDIVNQSAIDWVLANVDELASVITVHNRAYVAEQVARFFDSGLTMAEIEKNLLSRFGPDHAALVARTEITRAAVMGELAAVGEIEAAGIKMIPIWQTRHDDQVCRICGPKHNKEIKDGIYPPGHPGCRCWVNHKIAKGQADRLAELRAQAPGSTVSDKLRVPTRGAYAQVYKRALDAVDQVHDDGPLRPIPLKTNNAKSYYGQFCYDSIKVSAKGTHMEMTTLHEIGHWLDNQGLIDLVARDLSKYSFATDIEATNLLRGWAEAIEETDLFKTLTDMIENPNNYGVKTTYISKITGEEVSYTVYPDVKYLEYLRDPKELWARSYAQYIAEKSGDTVLLDQLERELLSGRPSQWAAADFAPIVQAIDALFSLLGWLK